MIEKLDMSLLAPIKTDLAGNARKVTDQGQSICLSELTSQRGLEGLEWGGYSVQFFTVFLMNIIDGDQPAQAGAKAYNSVLRQHHGPVLTKIFTTTFRFLPTIEKLEQQTGLTITEELVKEF